MDRSRITSEKMLAEVLRHEQGHYDIAYMEQQELIRALERTRFSANYQSEAQSLFNRIDNKYKQLNYDYDDDTSHMQNRNQQSSWDAFFRQKIKYLPEES
jgi:predicted secreted Zn-dependent protease